MYLDLAVLDEIDVFCLISFLVDDSVLIHLYIHHKRLDQLDLLKRQLFEERESLE